MSLFISICLLILVVAAVFYFVRMVLPTMGVPQPWINALLVLLFVLFVVAVFAALGYKPLGL